MTTPSGSELSPAFYIIEDANMRSFQLSVQTNSVSDLAYGNHTVEIHEMDTNLGYRRKTIVELKVLPCVSVLLDVLTKTKSITYTIGDPFLQLASI